ncbi:MAG: Dipeptide transport system permease protein DppB [Chloroflexi bacterium ADurb.Bin360]|nr:MAG: Dipeptide transport system permease protein DppB [Chloroflexi bacterium ADurb.Bin360]
MAEATLPQISGVETPQKKKGPGSWAKLARYTGIKLITLFIAVVIGIYLTILIANMGGYVDEILKGQIRESISISVSMDPSLKFLSIEERNTMINARVVLEEKRLGLDQPFLLRSVRFLTRAITLNLGRAQHLASDSGSKLVKNIILERLPPTLLLMATSNLLLFFLSLFFALYLSRNYGTFLDKAVIAMSPFSSAPAWFYGIFLLLLFASVLGWLPFGGMVAAPPPEALGARLLSYGRHLILPVTAWLISGIFSGVYGWRTFFLIFSMEDYVELARAKGLSSREIERRYVLRPTMPNIITSFALMMISLWQGATILETVFNWPGLGRMLFRAIGLYDSPVIIGSAIIYAYLLAATVFLLDFIYALVDPRVRVGSGGPKS